MVSKDRLAASRDARRARSALHLHPVPEAGTGVARGGSSGDLSDVQSAWSTILVMRRASRLIAVALLFLAVLCSPAGVCALDGMAAAAQAAAPAHAHTCCKSGKGPFLAASDGRCCSLPRTGFVTVLRFTLQKQATALAPGFALGPPAPARLVSFRAVAKRTPLVLRI